MYKNLSKTLHHSLRVKYHPRIKKTILPVNRSKYRNQICQIVDFCQILWYSPVWALNRYVSSWCRNCIDRFQHRFEDLTNKCHIEQFNSFLSQSFSSDPAASIRYSSDGIAVIVLPNLYPSFKFSRNNLQNNN